MKRLMVALPAAVRAEIVAREEGIGHSRHAPVVVASLGGLVVFLAGCLRGRVGSIPARGRWPALVLSVTLLAGASPVVAQQPSPRPVVHPAVVPWWSGGDLRDLPQVGSPQMQPCSSPQGAAAGASMPSPLLDCEGVSGSQVPDPTGAVGEDHYIQLVNAPSAQRSPCTASTLEA